MKKIFFYLLTISILVTSQGAYGLPNPNPSRNGDTFPELIGIEGIGPTGPTGPTGPAGATGATGPTGPTGASTTPVYAYVYELATIADATVVGGADIPFSNLGPALSITHTPGTTTITIPSTGAYQINFGVSITAGIGSSIAVAVNGTVNPSTNTAFLVAVGEIFGSCILDLNAGDIITLRNNSAIPLTMNLAPSVGASIAIVLVNGNLI